MGRRPMRDVVTLVALLLALAVLLGSAPTAGVATGLGPIETQGSASVSVAAQAASAHAGPYPIFNFKNADSPVVDPRTGYVYVADEGFGRTTIYDPATSAVVGFVDGAAGPMVLDPGSAQLIVLQGDGAVFVDLDTGRITATISGLASGGWRRPVLALDPVDGLVFAAYNYQTGGAIWLASTILVLSVREHAAIASIGGLWFTQGITYDSLNGRVYATNPVGGLTVIDPKRLAVVGSLSGLDGPNQIAVNPVDGYLYIPSYNGRVLPGTTGWTFTAGIAIVDPVALDIVGTLGGFHAGWDGPTFAVYNPGDGCLYIGNGTAIVAMDAASKAVRYEVGGLSDPGPLAVSPVNHHVYAPQADSLVDVNPATRNATVIGQDYQAPWGVAVDPVRNRVYASNNQGSTVVIIDAATDRIVGRMAGFTRPDAVVYDPLADELFVGNENGYGNYTLSIVNLTTEAVVGTISHVNPWTARFDRTTGEIIVGTDYGLTVISGRTNAILGNITTYGALNPIALDDVNGRLFAFRVPDIYSPGPDYLLAIHTRDWSLDWNITLTNLSITSLGFDPVNGNLYAGLWGDGAAVLDGTNGNVIARIPGPWEPQDVLFDPANGYVYITDQGSYGNLWVIDPATNQVVQSIELPDQANRMAYDPANQEIYIGLGELPWLGGLVLAVPSVVYPPPPITESPWFWPLTGVAIAAILVALAVVLRRRRARAGTPPELPKTPMAGPSDEVSAPKAAPDDQEGPPPVSRAESYAVLGVVVALAFMFAALAGPWFVVTTQTATVPVPATDSRGYGVGGWSATDTLGGVTANPSGNYIPSPNLGLLFSVMEVLVVAVLLAMLAVVVLVLIQRFRGRFDREAMLLGFGAGVVCLVASAASAILFPGAAVSDGLLGAGSAFAGASWGPGWAWILVVLAGILFLGSFRTLSRYARRSATARVVRSAP